MKAPLEGKPWRRRNPNGPKDGRTVLTAASKAWAKARAARAGRRYPNLIDNMAAAQRQKRESTRQST